MWKHSESFVTVLVSFLTKRHKLSDTVIVYLTDNALFMFLMNFLQTHTHTPIWLLAVNTQLKLK